MNEVCERIPRPPSIKSQLIDRKADLERSLAEINVAIDILDKNAELETLLTVVRRNC